MTEVNSKNNVSVDGMPRHILDVRRVVYPPEDPADEEEEQEMDGAGSDEMRDGPVEAEQQRPQRVRRPPGWLADYYTGDIE